jgi:NOL1/NOP2/fmu family ribosome biogenesis protein
VLIKYNGKAIGWVKNLGNRANNLYPKEWRIKSSHIPTTPPEIV